MYNAPGPLGIQYTTSSECEWVASTRYDRLLARGVRYDAAAPTLCAGLRRRATAAVGTQIQSALEVNASNLYPQALHTNCVGEFIVVKNRSISSARCFNYYFTEVTLLLGRPGCATAARRLIV